MAEGYGEIGVEGNGTATTFAASSKLWGQKSQVTVFNENRGSAMTVVDHTSDDITISKNGVYVARAIISASGPANTVFSFAIFKNNGATQVTRRSTVRFQSVSDVESTMVLGVVSLDAGDTIELWVQNEDSSDSVTIEDAALSVELEKETLVGIEVAVVRGLIGNAVESVDFTKSGFGDPDGALFFYTPLVVTDDTPTGDSVVSIGATDGTNQWCYVVDEGDGLATTSVQRGFFTTHVAAKDDNDGEIGFNSWITDGVRLDSDTANTDGLLTVVLFKSSGGIKVGTATPPAEDATTTISGVGFTAGCVIAMLCPNQTGSLAAGNSRHSLGFIVNGDTLKQMSVGQIALNNQGLTDVTQYVHTTSGNVDIINAGDVRHLEYGNFGSDGWDITARGGTLAARNYGYFALETPLLTGFDLSQIDSPTSTGSQVYASNSLTPVFCMIQGTKMSAIDTVDATTDAGLNCWSLITENEEFCVARATQDGASPNSNTQTSNEDQAVRMYDVDGTELFEANFTSFTTSGLTLNYIATDGTARKWLMLSVVSDPSNTGGGGGGGALSQQILVPGLG